MVSRKKSAQRVRRSLSADSRENNSSAYVVASLQHRGLFYNSSGKDIPGFWK